MTGLVLLVSSDLRVDWKSVLKCNWDVYYMLQGKSCVFWRHNAQVKQPQLYNNFFYLLNSSLSI